MRSERDSLKRALERLGRVPAEVLDSSRERVRRNLKASLRPIVPLPPPPDATQANLSALRRPFYVAAGMASVCALIVTGALVQWSPRTRSASKPPLQSASKQTPERNRQITQPLPVLVEESSKASSKRSEPKKMRSARAATHVAVVETPPLQPSPSQARFTLLPPGDGKVILDRACGGCHRAASVGNSHFASRAEYAKVVSRMIGMGAPVSEQERDVLIDYLFDNLGTKPERSIDTPGREILERACTTCHSLNGIESYAYDSEDSYRELVSTMISYGATLSEAEKATLVRYLFSIYGKR